MNLDAKIPPGPLAQKWDRYKSDMKLVNPANKRKFDVIVVGTGLSGAAAAATLAELGYQVKAFCFQDTPRRAHSIAAQGGINAAKNYQNDGDSVFRLFYDTIKGGDFRAREANVFRLAQVSASIIDQCAAQGVPFAREYGGTLANRSFGGAQVSRTFYARGQTGQQLLLGAYQAMCRQISLGNIRMFPRTEMLDLVVVDGEAKGIVVRNLVTGEISSHAADAVVLATGGYGNVFYPFHQCDRLQCHRHLPRLQEGRVLRQSLLHADPSDLHPGQRRSPVQAHAHVRVAAQRRPGLGAEAQGGLRQAAGVNPGSRTAIIISNGNIRATATSRRATSLRARRRRLATKAAASVPAGVGFIWISRMPSSALGENAIRERYGNLFEMYERITGENAYRQPMRIYPAVHYAMGGTWVDYNLMSTLPGLFVVGEANFSDHGANRLGASALMQGLGDGYFILPYTIGNYFASAKPAKVPASHAEFKKAEEDVRQFTQRLLSINGKRSVDELPQGAGQIDVGKLRHGAQPAEPGDQSQAHPGTARGILEERQGDRRAARN